MKHSYLILILALFSICYIFPSGFFQGFSLSLIFYSFTMIYLGVGFGSFILCGVLWAASDLWLELHFRNSQTLLLQIFLLLLLSSPLYICYTFCNYTTVTGILFISVFLKSAFRLERLYWYIFKLTDSWAMTCLLRSPSQAFFISVTVFLISRVWVLL